MNLKTIIIAIFLCFFQNLKAQKFDTKSIDKLIIN
jgi:hypothetical protein